MRAYDFSPLLRATVGYDRMMNLLDSASRVDESNGYPPYNIEKLDEDGYRVTMAVAGFAEAELNVTIQDETLTIEGKKNKEKEDERAFLHRGIAARNFKRSFQLADHIKVTGAKLENGLLHLELQREIPEAKKPRVIAIDSADSPKAIEGETTVQ